MPLAGAKYSTATSLGMGAVRWAGRLWCQWGARGMPKVSAVWATRSHSVMPPTTPASAWRMAAEPDSRRERNSQRVWWISPVAIGGADGRGELGVAGDGFGGKGSSNHQS